MILSFLSLFKKVAALFCTDIAAQGFGYVSYQAHLVQCGFIGASLSEPHTSVTALLNACVCMCVCLRVAIYRKFKLNERIQRYTYISNLHTC